MICPDCSGKMEIIAIGSMGSTLRCKKCLLILETIPVEMKTSKEKEERLLRFEPGDICPSCKRGIFTWETIKPNGDMAFKCSHCRMMPGDIKEQTEPPKIRTDKLSWWALPLTELQEVAKAFNHGVEKYKKSFTYRYGDGFPEKDMYDAVMRHMERIQAGELNAEDSGCLHWAHIAADALMAIAGILIRKMK